MNHDLHLLNTEVREEENKNEEATCKQGKYEWSSSFVAFFNAIISWSEYVRLYFLTHALKHMTP